MQALIIIAPAKKASCPVRTLHAVCVPQLLVFLHEAPSSATVPHAPTSTNVRFQDKCTHMHSTIIATLNLNNVVGL